MGPVSSFSVPYIPTLPKDTQLISQREAHLAPSARVLGSQVRVLSLDTKF